MAIYRIQRMFSTIGDKYLRLNHQYEDRTKADAHKEVLSTGRTDGRLAKNAKANTAGLGAVIGMGAAFIPKNKKAKIAAGIIGTAAGAGLGYAAQHATLSHLAKNKDSKRWQRYNDNMKVSDGEMSKEDFDKKWKNK